jgi:hypothetical protein
MAVALLALFVALGGVGYAAATIDSADIKDNTVGGKDVRNGTLRNWDVAPNALDGSRIRESRLRTVPGARRLVSPRGTFELARIDGEFDVSDPPRTILRLEGFVLRADCAPDGASPSPRERTQTKPSFRSPTSMARTRSATRSTTTSTGERR